MQNIDTDEITVKEIIKIVITWLKYLKTKWISIFVVGFLGCLLGLGYAYISKPVFHAKLTFALEEKTAGGASGISSIASSFGLNLGGSEGGAFAGDNILELMKSRFLIEKTLLSKVRINNKEELLINQYIKFNNLRKAWEKNAETKNIEYIKEDRSSYTRTQDSLLGVISSSILLNNLSVSKIDKKLSIISVQTSSKDELFSKLFCEKLVENVTDFYIQTKVGKSKKNVELLESRVDSVKRELDQAMVGRAVFSDQNQGLIMQRAAVPKLKQEMRVQMLGTMYGELVKNLEFSKLSLMREEPLIQVIDYPILPLSKEKFGMAKGGFFGFVLLGLLVVFYHIVRKLINTII